MNPIDLINRLGYLLGIAQSLEAGQTIEVYVPNREMWVTPNPEDIPHLLADALYPSDGGEPTKFRIAPKPEPKMPKGIFFVRFGKAESETYLPTRVSESEILIYSGNASRLRLDYLNSNYTWSRDRVTWYTFDNHETPVSK